MACPFIEDEEPIDEGAQIIQRAFFRRPPAPRVFQERTNPLEQKFLNIFITFPSHHGIQRIKEGFYAIAGFPNVLGCIDCTHIQIQAPPGPVERDFVDRRNNHSLNVQMICNSKLLITNMEAKWPGGVHDARILRESHLAQRLAQGGFEGVLLGDRGYPCLPYLLTPYPEPRAAAEAAFNNALSTTTARIEMTDGKSLPLYRDPEMGGS
ncbi:putative nuclease HARBI1 [Xyrichtys novacula]|uniref:Nuclease HARBI1 n=1 Tax=Xyrichtys novacula TaxID=13765 RepID=A0AAV1GXP3_XYRNO|nr:putative nuclease HARBI1 [Xyrichtys novacula]